ncbi:DNA-directed RNA polymerase subunit beta [Mycoplasmopsis edwardii]|uniref:DNA-directed RNA polymerase subunit beta n=1 Tax=Mycoplasmopsis edwardii TaxID=53558 RepID=A0A3B0PLN7_9BACT|nr:DNA-directed RNA polymerase subunit beta [Mycoplasmopsis edwardii]
MSGKEIPTPGTPESFNVLSYELKGLGMKLEASYDDNEDYQVLQFESGGEGE